MSRLGADPLQMEQLADVFDRESRSLRRSVLEINYLLRFTFWLGGRSDQFNAAWQQRDRRAMDRASEQLAALAGDLRRQAAQQVEASSGASLRPFPGSGSGLRDQPPPIFQWGKSLGGGHKVGPIVENLPEYEIKTDYYRQRTPEGDYEDIANSSVFIANSFGIDVGDIEPVLILATGGGSLATRVGKVAADGLISGPTFDASISAGVGTEYRWSGVPRGEGSEIYKHFEGKSRSTANRLSGFMGNPFVSPLGALVGYAVTGVGFGADEVHASIDAGEVDHYDSVVNWLKVDAQLDVSTGGGLIPNAGISGATSLLYGTESFESGGTAKIVRGDVSVEGSLDAAAFGAALPVSEIGGGLDVEFERRLVYDADGNPTRLELVNTANSSIETERGGFTSLIVSEKTAKIESIRTKYTFDLTDPETARELGVASNDDILPLSSRAFEHVDLAYGERYEIRADSSEAGFDWFWTAEMNERGESGSSQNTLIKPPGSSEFRSWQADS